MLKKCPVCRTVFQGRPNKIYCSVKCKRVIEVIRRNIKARAETEKFMQKLIPGFEFWEPDLGDPTFGLESWEPNFES
jgi:hypothetical protein